MDNAELLAAWDKGEEITTVDMGGMGDSYEMAIHLTGMEWLRFFLDEKPDLAAVKDEDRKRYEATIMEKIKPLGLQKTYGLSGAQWGAAANIGSIYYKHGYEKGLAMVEADRHIKLKKTPFPIPAEAVT